MYDERRMDGAEVETEAQARVKEYDQGPVPLEVVDGPGDQPPEDFEFHPHGKDFDALGLMQAPEPGEAEALPVPPDDPGEHEQQWREGDPRDETGRPGSVEPAPDYIEESADEEEVGK